LWSKVRGQSLWLNVNYGRLCSQEWRLIAAGWMLWAMVVGCENYGVKAIVFAVYDQSTIILELKRTKRIRLFN
jgi:hypothetical protein